MQAAPTVTTTASERACPEPPLILLVDDEEAVLRALAGLLRREGYRVGLARSGHEALALLARGLAPRVVISDRGTPGVSGVAFLTEVRERWPRIPRVLMTGHADMQAIQAAINEAGIHRLLAKPWDDEDLIDIVRSAVEQADLDDENARLQAVTRQSLDQLVELNRDLEGKVEERTWLLSRAKREWTMAFDALADPLMIVDRDYRILRANRALAAHLGHRVTEVAGQVCHEARAASPHAVAREESGICVRCPIARARAESAGAQAEIAAASGRIYEVGAHPMLGDDRGAVVCHYRDLTEKRAMERQLAQADKLAAMGLLAGGVAHEINNPLGAILAFAQLLLMEDDVGPEEKHDYLEEIERSALRCKEIVDRLLRFARQAKSEERRKVFDLNTVIDETAFLIEKSYLKAPLRLEKDLEDELWSVEGTPNEIAQVLLNLVTNARDAMSGVGTITVRTRNLEAEQAVELAVRDTGHGMPAEVAAKIFDPFFTTKPEGKGTGLGLAVSYGIVRDHRGRITVRSEPGVGTVFAVVLPRARASVPANV